MKIYSQNESVDVLSEKVYSQGEVDALLKKKKDVVSSKANQIVEEKLTGGPIADSREV